MFVAVSFSAGGDNESLDSFAMRENVTIAEDDMSNSSHLQGFEQVGDGGFGRGVDISEQVNDGSLIGVWLCQNRWVMEVW